MRESKAQSGKPQQWVWPAQLCWPSQRPARLERPAVLLPGTLTHGAMPASPKPGGKVCTSVGATAQGPCGRASIRARAPSLGRVRACGCRHRKGSVPRPPSHRKRGRQRRRPSVPDITPRQAERPELTAAPQEPGCKALQQEKVGASMQYI